MPYDQQLIIYHHTYLPNFLASIHISADFLVYNKLHHLIIYLLYILLLQMPYFYLPYYNILFFKNGVVLFCILN